MMNLLKFLNVWWLLNRNVLCFICLIIASVVIENRLQSLEKTNVETRIKQILEANEKRFEAYETEIQQLKSIVIKLKNERIVAKSQVEPANNQSTENNAIFRTCYQTHLANPLLKSGLHWIDPDGQGVGDDPIQVHCDMNSGTTSIIHDNELPTDVGHCAEPGCYSESISYSATMRQMTALAELSRECHQSIQYDCINAPFEMNGVVYSWWFDRNGNRQYFWAGSNESIHTCQCGIDKNCVDSINNCNCDSYLPTHQSDRGRITNKKLLPVSRLNFGRTSLKTSSGVYTLGRFECSGQVNVNKMASSCADLWKIGHILSGFYSVMGAKAIESVYCDFTKLPSEMGFENRFGIIDVKSFPTFFHVQKNTPFHLKKNSMPFEVERLNIGRAMNLTSGIFTAPRKGVYFFTFSGSAKFTRNYINTLSVSLVLNGKNIGVSFAQRGADGLFQSFKSGFFTISLSSTLNLKAGDKVWLQSNDVTNACLFDDENHITHFTGQLLREDISFP